MVSANDEAIVNSHSSPAESHDAAHRAGRPVSGAVAAAGAPPRPSAGSRPSSGGSLNDGQGKESRPTTRGTVRSHSSGSLSRADTVTPPPPPHPQPCFIRGWSGCQNNQAVFSWSILCRLTSKAESKLAPHQSRLTRLPASSCRGGSLAAHRRPSGARRLREVPTTTRHTTRPRRSGARLETSRDLEGGAHGMTSCLRARRGPTCRGRRLRRWRAAGLARGQGCRSSSSSSSTARRS